MPLPWGLRLATVQLAAAALGVLGVWMAAVVVEVVARRGVGGETA